MTQRPKELLDQVRACPELVEGMQIRLKHYAYSTEKTYVSPPEGNPEG